MPGHKISHLPEKQFTEDIIDNCFWVDDPYNALYKVPLKEVLDTIIKRANDEGLVVELKNDKIILSKKID